MHTLARTQIPVSRSKTLVENKDSADAQQSEIQRTRIVALRTIPTSVEMGNVYRAANSVGGLILIMSARRYTGTARQLIMLHTVLLKTTVLLDGNARTQQLSIAMVFAEINKLANLDNARSEQQVKRIVPIQDEFKLVIN